MSKEFSNKVVVITGGGGVLCQEMAYALAEKGAKIAILDLREENAKSVADKVSQRGATAVGLAANVLDINSLNKAHEQVVASLGKCDILINGAGGNHPKGTTSRIFFMSVKQLPAVLRVVVERTVGYELPTGH